MASRIAFLMFMSPWLVSSAAAADADLGKQVAERWCAQCHLVSEDQAAASADVPTFRTIAAKYDSVGALGALLADPHPLMPKMTLSHREMRDLLAYLETLRQN